ncbi:PP2C family protein-serine/threonine phosphatase [Tunturibacter empetritectus]|uniref:Sigma-B regulation protein RsbU (Phosphoserine phosphatase) n=1 Tax=Tunturiibacter lichenicola TaxID=2051959 RepID=A0A7W8J4G8_9BACT|nr:PP2C family protein-serine/threonine phosphatase [Edaphobacter lichenicola]MBB5342480.1 sigma-B regulation protein RsbU (phosphoserine phosphatase) [Edaphobacter lichenicola]
MYVGDPQLTASQVLRTFHHDELYLFLGAAFTALGLVSIAFAFLSRKFDAMLFWLALFAIFYGQRLWLRLGLLTLIIPPSHFFNDLRAIGNYLVPIPGFFYFQAAGFLGRSGRKIIIALTAVFLGLAVATMLFGQRAAFQTTNNVVVIVSLFALIIQSLTRKQTDRDFIIARRGIFVFVVFALFDNIGQAFGYGPFIEPIGFTIFLVILGYVAAKRSLHRDQQFSDLQKELDIARRIQTSILPPAYPQSAHFHVAARYVPMTAVAGDFYDFLIADQTQAGLLIADVSGHGVPAALIASMVKLAATSQRANAADPALLLAGMNSVLCGNTQDQFVTAAYVYLDAASSTLRYSAAAHPPMLLLREGSVIELTENGLMLAAFTFATYTTAEYALQSSDRLLLYTDGILEATNAQGEEFGSSRLHTLLKEAASLSADAAAASILSSLERWSSKSQNDDLTLLICDYFAENILEPRL